MPAPAEIKKLVEKFARNRDEYTDSSYNEHQVRIEFINPLLKALGWDVDNSEGASERYREVIHEDRVRVGGESKAPDYSCRLGGNRVFFVEAKKPSVDLKTDPAPAFQLRRYAWSAKLPVSVHTDFEELVIYDTSAKPGAKDKPTVGRLRYWTCAEFVEKWDEIAAILSKEAVKSGAFDKFAGERKRKATAQVDDDFLAAIEEWRDLLARDLAKENPKLDSGELSFAVQRILDRIVFLRICEDRGIESAGQLHALVNGPHIYARLKELFDRADKRYNSGLFHFREEKDRHESPDTLTPKLKVSDKVLKTVLDALYVDVAWAFAVIPADILGSIYEQFLGKVIHRDGRGVRIEEKPEVKKAGGVYYTPKYIVDYIVKETVGKLLEGKNLKEASELKILDPACGSGSFLIGAYQYLLDWHLDQYLKAREKHKKQLIEFPKGVWRLSSVERKRILTNSIFGVDIDEQAVEVTKLSLLLKVLEGESAQSLQVAFELMPERALPDLGDNVKCGNSLVANDFDAGQALLLGEIDETPFKTAFSYNEEFTKVFARKNPGFDVVIGNPPYIRMEAFKELKGYLKAHYKVHAERSDLYAYFLEKGNSLARAGGTVGMIVSNKFIRAAYGAPLRSLLVKAGRVRIVADFAGLRVFAGATVRTVILILDRGTSGDVNYLPPLPEGAFKLVEVGATTVQEAAAGRWRSIPTATLGAGGWSFADERARELRKKLEAIAVPLSKYLGTGALMGVKSGLTEAFIVSAEERERLVRTTPRANDLLFPVYAGADVESFATPPSQNYLIYTYHGVSIGDYPSVRDHLKPYQTDLVKRATAQAWYELQQPQERFADLMKRPKIVFPDIATRVRFCLDESGAFLTNTCYFLPTADRFLLGLLNSALAQFYFTLVCAGLEGGGETYLRFFGQYLEGFPVPKCGTSERMAVEALTTEILDWIRGHKPESRGESYERKLAQLQTRLDWLVAACYGVEEAELSEALAAV